MPTKSDLGTILRRDLKRICNPLRGTDLAWEPYAVPERGAVFATDCALFVSKRIPDLSGFKPYDEKAAKHILCMLDAPVSPEARTVDVGRLRRWSGPAQWLQPCDLCEDDAFRIDPCWLGPALVNRNCLAIICRYLVDGAVRISLPAIPNDPVQFDKDEWRALLMTMTSDRPAKDAHKDADLPRFYLDAPARDGGAKP